MNSVKKLIVIQGPTASGKTALSIALALELNCVILSADSRQFYTEISIGTAKPTFAEMKGVPHFFIDSHTLNEPVSAAQFEKEALAILEKMYQEHDVAILVGGSGLFIDALCYGLDPLPSDSKVKKFWEEKLQANGLPWLQNELYEKDPEYAKKVDLENPHRVLRALEILTLTGKSMSEVRSNSKQVRNFENIRYVLDMPRENLYKRIDQRVLQMMKDGLLEEVKQVKSLAHLQSLNTVGYKELFDFIDGKITLETAVEQIQQNSRRYAKRQLTWFRRDTQNQWLTSQTTEDRLMEIMTDLKEKQIIS